MTPQADRDRPPTNTFFPLGEHEETKQPNLLMNSMHGPYKIMSGGGQFAEENFDMRRGRGMSNN